METKIKQLNGVDVARLFETIEAVENNHEVGAFQFRAEKKWVNGAFNQTRIKGFYGACGEDITRRSAFVFSADEPDILLGTNNAPNPTEALLHALASCITTTLVYHASAKGIKLDAVSSSYEGDLDLRGFLGLDPEVPKGYQSIRMAFTIEGDLTPDQKEDVLATGRDLSPVHELVSKVVPLEVILN